MALVVVGIPMSSRAHWLDGGVREIALAQRSDRVAWRSIVLSVQHSKHITVMSINSVFYNE